MTNSVVPILDMKKKLSFLLFLCFAHIVAAQNPIEPPKDLPTIRIQTEYSINKSWKVKAQISIEDTVRGERELHCGIELRGNSTLLAEKKSYDFELRTAGDEELTESILGFPQEEDFVLLANYYDKSFARNALAFKMWEVLGHYTPKYVYCNLYLNDEYQGLYMLVEKVKADQNRIDLKTEYRAGEQGFSVPFMVKLDWESNYNFGYRRTIGNHPLNYNLVYPKAKKLDWRSRNAIESQLELMTASFEDLLKEPEERRSDPYSKIIDVNSFVDYFLVNELCKNPDGFKTSTHLYKPTVYASDGIHPKISIGPIWDMDLGFANVEYGNYNDPEGWSFHEYGAMSNVQRLPNWWHCLVYDSTFIAVCQERLLILKEQFSMNSGGDLIDNLYVQLKDVIAADNEIWRKESVGKLTVQGPVKTDMDEQFTRIREFYTERFDWVENNLDKIEKVHPSIAYIQSLNLNTVQANMEDSVFQINLPNAGLSPLKKTSGMVEVYNPYYYENYVVKNVQGEIVAEGKAYETFSISCGGWASGEYYLEVIRQYTPTLAMYEPQIFNSYGPLTPSYSMVAYYPNLVCTSTVNTLAPPYIVQTPSFSYTPEPLIFTSNVNLSYVNTANLPVLSVPFDIVSAPPYYINGLSAVMPMESGDLLFPPPIKEQLKLRLLVP